MFRVVRPSFVAIVFTSLLLALPTQVSAEALVPPSPPMNVEVEETAEGATITWDAPAFDGGSDQLTYRVYRDDTLIAEDLTTTSYLDVAVGGAAESASVTAVHYTVTAVNEAGESAHSVGGTCIMVEGPEVNPWACIDLVIDTAKWVVGQLPPF